MILRKLLFNDCIRLVLLVCLAFIFDTSVYAGVENRPINTDDAYTLDKGALTIALGAVFTKADNGDKENNINIDLGYGITDRFEITVDFPFVFSDPKAGSNEEGIGDISVRPEFMFLEETENIPAMSFAATFKFQSGNEDKGLGSGETDYSLSLQFSKDFSPLKCHFNIGYTFVGQPKGETVDDVIFYNLACEYSLNDKLTLVGELIGDTNSNPNQDDNPFEGLIGFVYNINNNLALDFGIGAGFTNASPDILITSGLTYQF